MKNETELPLDDIQARADAATPGPWQQSYFAPQGEAARRRVHPEDRQRIDLQERLIIRGAGKIGTPGCNQLFRLEGVEATEANAAFIAHARQDVPALIAEIRRLQSAEQPKGAPRRKMEELADGFKAIAREMLDESKWKPGADRAYRYDKTARAETYESAAWNIAKILADTVPLRSAEQPNEGLSGFTPGGYYDAPTNAICVKPCGKCCYPPDCAEAARCLKQPEQAQGLTLLVRGILEVLADPEWDPNDIAADGGVTCLDVVRKDAKTALGGA